MMQQPHQSRLLSILLSTGCMVAFGFLAAPVIKPGSALPSDIEIRQALTAEPPAGDLRVPAGKTVVVESSSRIVATKVADPSFIKAVPIGDYEILLNGKAPGRTEVTLLQADGRQRTLDIHVDLQLAGPTEQMAGFKQDNSMEKGLSAAYQDAMSRVQSAITGVNR